MNADSLHKKSFPWGTLALAGLMILAFSWEKRAMNWGMIHSLIDDFSFSWIGFCQSPWHEWPKIISHTFLHANESHLIGNLLFFLLFSPGVEQTLGTGVHLLLYFFCATAAVMAQGIFLPYEPGLIGASGAISGMAGAYFVLFPLRSPSSWFGLHRRLFFLRIPPFFWIGVWFLGQIHDAFRIILPDLLAGQTTRIAYWAHIGGFLAGGLAMLPLVFFTSEKSGGGAEN